MHRINQPAKASSVDALSRRIAKLQARRLEIDTEINAYPPPIPACDAQFNYLLEQRADIAQQIDALKQSQNR